MPREYTVQNAIMGAVLLAHDKWQRGLLISCDHPDYDKIMGNCCVEGIEGDPESVYSIISLYADDENNDGTWEDAIESILRETYESYF